MSSCEREFMVRGMSCITLLAANPWNAFRILRTMRSVHEDAQILLEQLMKRGPKRKSLAERFWPKVDKAGPVPTDRPDLGPCWLWLAALNPQTGYGQIAVGGKHGGMTTAHRVAYELAKGPIPLGCEPDHLCRVRRCVNPDHLEAVTKRENILRGTSQSAAHAVTTHCPKGHPYAGSNLIVEVTHGKESRRCRICKAEKDRRHKEKKLIESAGESKAGVNPPRTP